MATCCDAESKFTKEELTYEMYRKWDRGEITDCKFYGITSTQTKGEAYWHGVPVPCDAMNRDFNTKVYAWKDRTVKRIGTNITSNKNCVQWNPAYVAGEKQLMQGPTEVKGPGYYGNNVLVQGTANSNVKSSIYLPNIQTFEGVVQGRSTWQKFLAKNEYKTPMKVKHKCCGGKPEDSNPWRDGFDQEKELVDQFTQEYDYWEQR